MVDCYAGCISVCLSDGSFVRSFGQFKYHTEYGQGLLYVAGNFDCRVSVLRRDGSFVRSIGGPGWSDGQMSHPYGVAVVDKEVCVVELASNQVQVRFVLGC